MQHDPASARRALHDGALAYVLKESADTDLIEAIRRAAAGEAVPAARRRPPAPAAEPVAPVGDLTLREIEVLRLIALGHTSMEIADRLTLSVRTIESHRAHIQRKLGFQRRAELVRYALDHRLLAA